MSKILVTGGAGFIGSYVTKLLADSGHKVVVLDNLSHGFAENIDRRAKFIAGDIKDKNKTKKALEGVGAIEKIDCAKNIVIGVFNRVAD